MKKLLLNSIALLFFGLSAYANDCNTATPVTIGCGSSITVTGSTVGGTPPAISTCITSAGTGGAVWYTFVGDGNPYMATTDNGGSNYDTKIWVFSGSCGGLTCVTGDDDGGTGLLSLVNFNTTPGVTYYVIVGGFSSSVGNYEMTIANQASACGDNCSSAMLISNSPCGDSTGYVGTTVGGLPSGLPTCGTTAGTGGVKWFTFTGDGTNWTATTDNVGTNYDTKIWVFSGNCTSGPGTIDVNAPTNNTCMANFSQTDLAQSFIPTVSTICGAGIELTSNGAGSGDVTISLYDALPNAGGVLMASGTINATDGTWADVTWPSVNVTPGNTYYLVFTSTNGSQCIAGDTGNGYSGGMVFANPGYSAFTTYDYTFHTYGGCGASGLTCVTGDDDGGTGLTSLVNFPTTAGVDYFVIVGGFSSNEGNYELTVTNIGSDTQAPVPNATTLDTLFSECDVMSVTPPTALDNCAGAMDGVSNVSFPIVGEGTTTITWTYDDGNGNVVTQNQVVVIDDVTPPLYGTPSGSIDVDAPTNNTCMATFNQTDVAQSFIPNLTTICGAGIELTSNGAGSGDVTIALYDALPNAGGVMLASGTVTAVDGTWANVSWPTVSVVPGTTYYIVFTSTNGSQCIAGDTGNGYTGGMVFANAGYNAFTTYDYTFHTYGGCSSGVLSDTTSACQLDSLAAPIADDNCAGSITGVPDVVFPISVLDTTIVTWSFDDGNGNISTVQQVVIIVDTLAPSPTLASLADYNGCVPATPVAPTADDSCAGTITGVPDVTFPITTGGTTVVTWTYDDGNGNTSTQTQNVIVNEVDVNVTQTGSVLTATMAGATYQWLDCDNNYSSISGATSQTFTPSSVVGNYAVAISANGCTDTSACFMIDMTGINEGYLVNARVYPNPSTGIFTVQSESLITSVVVTDMAGRVVTSNEVGNINQFNIDLSKTESGNYLLKLFDNDRCVFIERIVKR